VEGEDGEFSWAEFYRSQFQEVVTEEAIERFKKEYQGGEEEKMHVIEAYVSFEGDMNAIFETVMLSNPLDDEERFRAIIDSEITEKRVEAYAGYAKETKASKRKRRDEAKREAQEAEEMAKDMGLHEKLFGNGKARTKTKAKEEDMGGLAALIHGRQQERQKNFFEDLEKKYAPKGKKKRQAEDEPPEDAFEKNREKGKKARKSAEEVPARRQSKRSKR
jgi:DnaJ homolog subfamily C member 9